MDNKAAIGLNDAGLHIRLLGGFVVEHGRHPLASAIWQRSHPRRLLQLLCSAPKLSESRKLVLEELWPESDEARARNRLHHTVHFIRKAWECIPEAERPQLLVGAERVEFRPAPSTVIDVQLFCELAQMECQPLSEQLECLEQAISLYRGPLATDWDGSEVVERRRQWLACLREGTLGQAVTVAIELGRTDRALRHAEQLAQLLPFDCAAQCQYAVLLADSGRADLALQHCQSVRPMLQADAPEQLPLLNETIQTIQRRTNTTDAVSRSVAGDPQPTLEAPPVVAQGTARVPYAAGPMSGFDRLAAVCVECIEDPYGVLTTLVGPPGVGKTRLALSVAESLQRRMRHGALWVECSGLFTEQALCNALAQKLLPLCGPIAADTAALGRALSQLEILVVLDDIDPAVDQRAFATLIAQAGADTRWLITAWTPRQLRGERIVRVEPQRLLRKDDTAAASPAAQIVLHNCPPVARAQAQRSLATVERIAVVLDGLPALLEAAGECLGTLSPNELEARLNRDPHALMRAPAAGDPIERDSALRLRRLMQWLELASPSLRDMLRLLGRCQSWLERSDIGLLLETSDEAAVDALVEYAVRHQFLLRRRREDDVELCSEFRVPRSVVAAVQLFDHNTAGLSYQDKLERWLVVGHRVHQTASGAAANGAISSARASRWFDAHVLDIDAVVLACIECGRPEAAAAILCAHAPHWSVGKHALRLKSWLDGLGQEMRGLDTGSAGTLLLARARLRVHLGELRNACEDASLALARLCRERDAFRFEEATQLLQRYGTAGPAMAPQAPQLRRGVEAGESLLRVAKLAVRHGRLTQAIPLCDQAVKVFDYFGLPHNEIRAHHYRSRIAYSLGDLDLADRCLVEAERIAERIAATTELVRTRLMQADVLVERLQFARAIELAASQLALSVCSQDPLLAGRAVAIEAWAHYGQGAYRIARALCKDMRASQAQTGSTSLCLSIATLSALVEARIGSQAEALRTACEGLEWHRKNESLLDVQHNLINAAELAICLERPDLAQPALDSLAAYTRKPGHRLRPWMQLRLEQLLVSLNAPAGQAEPTSSPTVHETDEVPWPETHVDVLTDLITRPGEL
jgi:DNA-binding SARP family transcriptional activator/tetratricopeptide (TPR) repeat protein